MNTSQYMDKQIMDLSAAGRETSSSPSSHTKPDFINFMNTKDDHVADDNNNTDINNNTDAILPNYDFQPMRSVGFSPTVDGGVSRVWNSSDSKVNTVNTTTLSGTRSYGSLDSVEPTKVIIEKDRNSHEAALVSEIDQTMKKHSDNLLHALQGISARLTQLETRTRHLENSVDDLQVSVGNNHGSTDGKIRQLENILREVHTNVQLIRDNNEIVEAQLQLAKMQMPKADQHHGTQNTDHRDNAQQTVPAPQQYPQLQVPPVTLQSSPTPQPPPNAPPPSQYSVPPQAQVKINQYPQNSQNPYFQPPSQAQQEAQSPPQQQYLLPSTQQAPYPPQTVPHQQYQPSLHPQHQQPPQQLPSVSPANPPPQQPQPQTSLSHRPEDMPYLPHQTYPPNLRQSSTHPSSAPQQFFGLPSDMYGGPSLSRSNSGFSSNYGLQTGPKEPYSYNGSTPRLFSGNSTIKPQHVSSSGYPQLPTARILPQAIPTASGASTGSGSAGTGNRVPVDDVIDKVTTMGFPRDVVRATVKKLTENGQSVDLNIVLDKLMNDGDVDPPNGWFNR